MSKDAFDRIIFARDRDGNLPTREKVLERALVQIQGKAHLAGDVLGPDAVGARSWGLIESLCGHALAATSSPDGRRMAETAKHGSGRKPDQQVPGSE